MTKHFCAVVLFDFTSNMEHDSEANKK